MSAIYGLIRLDGAPVEPEVLRVMREPIRHWGPDGGGEWRDGPAAFGQLVLHVTPESLQERGPVLTPAGDVVTAAARLDNRDELLQRFGLEADAAETDVVAAAWQRWGEATPLHLLGDWAFAAWNPRERKLFLARDHYGNTALYHHRDAHTFAFATGRLALLALPHVTRRLDETQLARQLSWWIVDGGPTLDAGVERLPPAHLLTLRDSTSSRREYWRMGDVAPVRLRDDGQYVDRFLELYSAAIRVRLRSLRPVTTTLSAGLDSGSVTALAARQLGSGEMLTAFTSVPLYREVVQAEMPGELVDEWDLAHATATRYANIEHVAITASELTPLQAIERLIATTGSPEAGAGNLHWGTAMLDEARRRRAGVLLTGQYGNGGISWIGPTWRALDLLRRGDLRGVARVVREIRVRQSRSWPRSLLTALFGPIKGDVQLALARRRARTANHGGGFVRSDFIARSNAFEARRSALLRHPRLAVMLPGLTPGGALWHEAGASAGLDVRDPTADTRLLEFCFGVPDTLFARAESSRWLLRRSMEGILPPEVQWNVRRGRQGADIAYRLRADHEAVSAMMRRIAASDAAREYLDVAGLAKHWERIKDPSERMPSRHAALFVTGLLWGVYFVRRLG